MRLRSLRMANDETLHRLFRYLSDQSTIVVCIRFFSKSRNQIEAMNDKWVGGLGLDQFWEKGQQYKSKLHRCPWSGHPSQTFGESNGGLQWCALAQNSKCELIQLPARLACLELRPKKAGWRKHPEGTRNSPKGSKQKLLDITKTHKPAIVWARHVFPEPVLPINMRTFSPSVALLRSGSCSFCI